MSAVIQGKERETPSTSTKSLSRRDLLNTAFRIASLLPLTAACAPSQTPPNPPTERDVQAEDRAIAPYLQLHRSHVEPIASTYINKKIQHSYSLQIGEPETIALRRLVTEGTAQLENGFHLVTPVKTGPDLSLQYEVRTKYSKRGDPLRTHLDFYAPTSSPAIPEAPAIAFSYYGSRIEDLDGEGLREVAEEAFEFPTDTTWILDRLAEESAYSLQTYTHSKRRYTAEAYGRTNNLRERFTLITRGINFSLQIEH